MSSGSDDEPVPINAARRRGHWIAVAVVLLTVGGWWLADAVTDARNAARRTADK